MGAVRQLRRISDHVDDHAAETQGLSAAKTVVSRRRRGLLSVVEGEEVRQPAKFEHADVIDVEVQLEPGTGPHPRGHRAVLVVPDRRWLSLVVFPGPPPVFLRAELGKVPVSALMRVDLPSSQHPLLRIAGVFFRELDWLGDRLAGGAGVTGVEPRLVGLGAREYGQRNARLFVLWPGKETLDGLFGGGGAAHRTDPNPAPASASTLLVRPTEQPLGRREICRGSGWAEIFRQHSSRADGVEPPRYLHRVEAGYAAVAQFGIAQRSLCQLRPALVVDMRRKGRLAWLLAEKVRRLFAALLALDKVVGVERLILRYQRGPGADDGQSSSVSGGRRVLCVAKNTFSSCLRSMLALVIDTQPPSINWVRPGPAGFGPSSAADRAIFAICHARYLPLSTHAAHAQTWSPWAGNAPSA